MTIDFEKDQEEVLDKTTNINKLADKIKEMQAKQTQLELQEDSVKKTKKDIEHLSGEIIPTSDAIFIIDPVFFLSIYFETDLIILKLLDKLPDRDFSQTLKLYSLKKYVFF